MKKSLTRYMVSGVFLLLIFLRAISISLKEFQKEFNNDRVQICYQLLPPFAWYFGGSVKVNVFDSMYDYKIISKYDIPICIDLSHLLMSSYF